MRRRAFIATLAAGSALSLAARAQERVRRVGLMQPLAEDDPEGPSLLMRARALATVREWKKRLEHQAHSRPCHRGGYGLPVATGAVS